MIERIHLAILEALEREGTLSRAADALGLTQSALTHSIRKLEDLSGARIWEKRGRTLELTTAGREVLATSRSVLPRLDALDRSLRAFGSGTRGTLRIGVECHPCFEWLMGLLDDFLADWPDIDVDVLRDLDFDGLGALEDRKVDLLVTPDCLPRRGLVYQGIHSFELELLVASNSPLASRDWVEPGDLADQVLLTYPIPRHRLDVFAVFLDPAGVEPARHQQVEAVELMVQLAAAGRGVSTFPDWLARRYASEFAVVGKRLGAGGIQKELYLVHRDGDEEIRYLGDLLQRAGEDSARGCVLD